MVTPGSSTGRVNEQQQGTGLATILQGDRALDTFDRLAFEDRSKKAAAEAQKKADMNAAYDRMIKFNPERWYKHDNQVRESLNSWFSKGAEIMARGTDPWKGTDAESLAWRKDQLTVAGKAMASKQLQERFNALRTKIDGAEPDKYTAASLANLADFFEKDLTEVIDKGLVPPDLMQRRPMLQLQDYFSKVVQPIAQKKNGNPFTEDELWDIAKTSVVDPEKGDDLADSFRSALAQMDEVQRKDVEKRAKNKGVSIQQQMAYDYASKYATERKPFDYNDWKKVALARVDVPYKEWQGSENFSKKVDKAELDRIVNTVARDMFVSDDRALLEYEEILPRDPNETDGKYRDRAIADLAKNLRAETATQEMSGQRQSGKEKQDLTVSRTSWLDAIMSPDPEKYREAAGYLFQSGDLMGNMTVADSRVIPAQQSDNMQPFPVLRLALKGNLSLEDVTSQLPTGVEVSEVTQRGTETDIEIPITNQTENYLLSLHDNAFDQKKKTPFAGTFRENKPVTLSGLAKQSTPQPSNNAPKQKTFDFK